ncbi:MAG: polymerase sigma-70 factor, subfamily [Clostridia bacterium]|nr:polymerase sigma-70 factor, subfamily [Clostridia bacterium]
MLVIYLSMLNGQEDKNKFELLYEKYRKLMFYIANNILNDEYLAEDAVHQTFIKILKNLDKIDDVFCHKTKSFIVIMVRNTAINMYNRRKRSSVVPFDEAQWCIDREALEAAEGMEMLIQLIINLPVIYKDVLTLKYVHGFSNVEIASLLGISEAAVRKRLERARRKLNEAIKEEGEKC